jgi:hypothetical protein
MRRTVLTASAILLVFGAPVDGARFAFVPAADTPHGTDLVDGPVASDFTYLGDPHTKWEPGGNAAMEFTSSPPAGPWRPGGATFSVMGAGYYDVSGFDSTHGSFLTVEITSLGVPGFKTIGDYAEVLDWALDQWDAVSGFENVGQVADGGVHAGAAEAAGGHLGDIRVAAWEIVSPSTIARAFQPGTEGEFGPGGTISGDLYFDVNRTWIDNAHAGVGEGFDIYTVALHEIGHALGLGHSSDAGSVMRSGYFGARRTLGADDVAGIRAIYGPPEVPEPSAITVAALLLCVAAASTRRCLLRTARWPQFERREN